MSALTDEQLAEIEQRRGVRTIVAAGGDLIGEGDRDISRLVAEVRSLRDLVRRMRTAASSSAKASRPSSRRRRSGRA